MTKRTIEVKNGDSDKSPEKGNGTAATEDNPKEEETVIEEPDTDSDADEAEDVEEEKVAEPTVEEQLTEMTGRLQRMAAEFENYKKKNAREFERGHQAGAVRIIDRLLPVLDSFDSAQQSQREGSGEILLEGFQKIHQQMIEALLGAGLEIIEPEQGTPLDPKVHEVLLTQPTKDVPEDTIFATFQRGYSLKGWLIRPAKVQVAKKPDA